MEVTSSTCGEGAAVVAVSISLLCSHIRQVKMLANMIRANRRDNIKRSYKVFSLKKRLACQLNRIENQ